MTRNYILALLLYTTVLVIAQETEYMWSKRFSFPTILYIFTRYGNLVLQGLNFWLLFVPVSRSLPLSANTADHF